MPYNKKIKRRCNLQSKQKELITTRLMEISLKVEDYVYNNKTIAVKDAEQLIQEVASYKHLCSNDERCLQVIEKLTRIMKGIIAEQQELTVGNIHSETSSFENNYRIHDSISPVYSIPDEDRTQLSPVIPETILEANDYVTAKGEKEIIDLCDSDDERLQEDISQGIPSMVADVVIHRGISNLSLTLINEESIQMTPANEECSQSILKHCENIEINKVQIKQTGGTVQVTPPDSECSQSILNFFENIDINNESVTRNNVSSKEKRTVVTNDYETNVMITTDPIKDIRQHNKVVTASTGAIPKLNNNLTLTIDPPQTTASNIQCVYNNKLNTSLYTQNVTKVNNPSTAIAVRTIDFKHGNKIPGEGKNIITNKVTNNLPNKISLNMMNDNCSKASANKAGGENIPTQFNTEFISNKKKEIKNNTANTNKIYKPKVPKFNATYSVNLAHVEVNQEEPGNNDDKPATATKKTSRKKKSKETPEKEDNITFKKPPVKRTVKYKNVKQTHKIIKIYNNNTQNDLSWVENIRFVREIHENEYDRHSKFEEDFWDNCSLPGIFDDQDFKY